MSPRGLRQLHDFEARRIPADASRGHEDPLEAVHLDGQPVLRGAVQDAELPPGFPDRFGSIEDARSLGEAFFLWYNHQHRHSGIGYMTSAAVHSGRAEQIHERSARVLATAYVAHPERFVHGVPQPPALPTAAWINQPRKEGLLTNS